MAVQLTKKVWKMSEKLSLKAMKAEMMSPLVNPLVEPQQLQTKRRLVKSGRSEDLVNPATGEITGVAAIHQIEERDDAEFVKVFAAGVSATYELTKTAQRVFQVVLDQYQRTPMSRGYADSVELFWFGDGINGRDVDMSERTWMRGLKELLEKRFLYPKTSSSGMPFEAPSYHAALHIGHRHNGAVWRVHVCGDQRCSRHGSYLEGPLRPRF